MPYGIAREDLEPGILTPGKLGNELQRFSKVINVGDIAADSDLIVIPLFKPPYAITIKRILIGFDTAITKADTNYQKYNVTDGTNIIATVSTGPNSAAGTSFVVGVFQELTLVATYVAIAATETITLSFVKAVSGMVASNCCIQIDYTIDDPA